MHEALDCVEQLMQNQKLHAWSFWLRRETYTVPPETRETLETWETPETLETPETPATPETPETLETPA